ncbi:MULTISPECIES: Fic family protein [Acinetobacter]|uniref:Fic family protein n=1 Tax=Acinetobacter TaxID=469 RepID=UPI0002AED21A|nr:MULTISPECIES: Fic family protein [Acinetobacter]MDQ9824867.1 Fic family protein [Acinetobacter sp. 163]ELW95395.1 Fic/DOC family protein [Acinetobacter baumannii OIFC047]MDE9412265.1 Fic family protein [Acinetobacter nosocomialis]TPT69320.1 Fic family protein [Acinetobacter baumannii]HAV3521316.1 Fic family protein [Acinetobacter baumannii]
MFEIIDDLKAKLDQHRPLSSGIVKNLHEDLILRWTYHSNAIEGNTLTLLETKVVLEGITVGGKALREHFEAINHRDAILYVEDIIKKQEPFSEWQIRNIHQLILRNIDDENAGRYRQQNVLISGATTNPPDHTLLNDKMAQFIDWYNQEAHKLHSVERAAKVHADFVGIHPFVDGSGGTSRLLMNLELMKAGYPPSVITVENRLAYYEALDQWMAYSNSEPFNNLVAAVVLEGFKPYQTVLGI